MHADLENSSVIAQRLRELPAELPPPLSWTQFEQRMGTCARAEDAPWVSKTRPKLLALAAGLAAFVAGIAMWSRFSPPRSVAQVVNTSQAELPMLTLPDPRSIEQSKASERWLARMPAEPAVMRVGTRLAVADLEDRIAWMDDVLSDESLEAVNPTHVVALQYERARLVNSLAQVRYAETLAASVP